MWTTESQAAAFELAARRRSSVTVLATVSFADRARLARVVADAGQPREGGGEDRRRSRRTPPRRWRDGLAAPSARPSPVPRAAAARRGGSGPRRTSTTARRSPMIAASWKKARGEVGPLGPLRRRQDDDREVPQVDAVGALADPAHRPAADDRPSRAAGCVKRGDDQHRGQREEQEPAAVEERRELARAPEHQRDHGQAEDADARRSSGGPRRVIVALSCRLGQTIASAAPMRSSCALVSVP